jgi:uncharacterized protein
MTLKELVNATVIEAMKAKDTDKLRTYRSIKTAFMVIETAGDGPLTEDDYLKAIIKMAKQRKDSIAIFKEQGRQDLADPEEVELNYIEELLPKQLSEDEIKAAVQQIIDSLQAQGMKDMGKVMGAAQQQLGSAADGKLLSSIVRSLLA